MTSRWTRLLVLVIGVSVAAQGVWAFASPRSFYDTLATFEPYNAHFLRDIGSAQIAIGAAAVVSVLHPRAIIAGLTGLVVFQVVHVASHVVDRDQGGNPGFDIPALTVLALITAAALIVELRPRPDQ
jgi:hypothetical protein